MDVGKAGRIGKGKTVVYLAFYLILPIVQSNFKQMNATRREFFKKSAIISAGSAFLGGSVPANNASDFERYAALDEVLSKPVLKKELFPEPVIIDTLELLRFEDNFLCRVRSKAGAEGISVSNNMQMVSLYPIFTRRLQPFFPGKDARNLEQLLEEVYVYHSNYKLQNLALWVPLATIEFAILDMLGKIAGKPMGELIGEIHHPKIAVYQANNFRGNRQKNPLKGLKNRWKKQRQKL
jgi:hypothetical protein